MNFVETMALYRAFSVGRFRCSRLKSKVSIVTAYPSEGYHLTIKKDPAKAWCLGCIRYFGASRGLLVAEDENYLTISSP